MRLLWIRKAGKGPDQTSRDYTASYDNNALSEGTAYVDFKKVSGETHWFKVSLDWPDVEALIAVFSEMGHPSARRLHRASKLAASVEELVKD